MIHQATLFGSGPPGRRAEATTERRRPTPRSWIDLSRRWWEGTDELFEVLLAEVAWRQGRRRMYDRVLDDPRLSHWYRRGDDLPHAALVDMRQALEADYGVALRGPALNLYRDGRDSVAPHADRELRRLDDTLVAIVTLGATRPFLVRPQRGGTSWDLRPADGDLLVMGGGCQQELTHGVPKAAVAGPRISISWRWTAPGGAADQEGTGTRRV